MTDSLWLPGLTVLAAGLAVGWWFARRLASRGRRPSRPADLGLAVADLERRLEQIYARLRGEADEPVGGEERRQLELSAARILRELDEKRPRLAPRKDKKKGARKGAKKAPPAADASAGGERPAEEETGGRGGFASRHPLTAGFLLGAGMVAIVGVLIYWAVRDARPRPQEMAAAAPAGPSPEEAHGGTDDLPITLAVELDALNERVAVDGADMTARRERALFYLGIERYVEAFEDANALLAADPRDIDGLYVQAVVRLTMGQEDQALALFDQVIGLFPDHVQALVWRGILLFRGGDRELAIASWRRAIDVSGGSQPEIEELIRAAEESPQAAPPPPSPIPDVAPRAAAAAPSVGADSYGVRVTIAEGAFPPPGGILFVSLRPVGGGPPVAVKRVDRVTGFPLDLTLGAADSMMGQELPRSGIVRVKLDADGSASTSSPDDLEAEAEGSQGATVSLVLG